MNDEADAGAKRSARCVSIQSDLGVCQPIPPLLPVGHHAPQHPPVGGAVVRDPQVHEFVRDYVVETPGR